MKFNFIKQPGGVLHPATDLEAERMNRFKTGDMFEIDIKNARNSAFHGKVFAFINYCFEFWQDDREFVDPTAQFERFRKEMTITAGYYNKVYNLQGEFRLEAKSISFSNMTQEEFEHLYTALVNSATKNIFSDKIDDDTYQKLMSFF